jgi:hypothetical protein
MRRIIILAALVMTIATAGFAASESSINTGPAAPTVSSGGGPGVQADQHRRWRRRRWRRWRRRHIQGQNF